MDTASDVSVFFGVLDWDFDFDLDFGVFELDRCFYFLTVEVWLGTIDYRMIEQIDDFRDSAYWLNWAASCTNFVSLVFLFEDDIVGFWKLGSNGVGETDLKLVFTCKTGDTDFLDFLRLLLEAFKLTVVI